MAQALSSPDDSDSAVRVPVEASLPRGARRRALAPMAVRVWRGGAGAGDVAGAGLTSLRHRMGVGAVSERAGLGGRDCPLRLTDIAVRKEAGAAARARSRGAAIAVRVVPLRALRVVSPASILPPVVWIEKREPCVTAFIIRWNRRPQTQGSVENG